MKILHLPKVTAGFSSHLSQIEAAFGYESTVANYFESPYGYPCDVNLTGKSRIASWAKRIAFLARSRSDFDIVHFNNGESLFQSQRFNQPLMEGSIWSASQKVMTFTGSDARIEIPKLVSESLDNEMGGARRSLVTPAKYEISQKAIDYKNLLFERASKLCDHVYCLNPDLLKTMPSTAVLAPYPIPPNGFVSTKNEPKRTGPLRIAHVASDPVFKGTSFVEAALAEIASSVEIESRILVQAPRSDVLDTFLWADVVVDQLCLGWFGTQALEAMSAGALVVCNIAFDVPDGWPLKAATDVMVNCDKDGLADVLAKLATDPTETRRRCAASHAAVSAVDPFDILKFYYPS